MSEIQVYKTHEGDPNCEHDWLCELQGRKIRRICRKCGRVEKERLETFESLYRKFHKKD